MFFPVRRLVLAAALSSGGALAQEAAPAAESLPADDASITSQVASFAVTKLKDSPAVVTVLSGEELREAGVRDLVDVLQLVPGMFIGTDTQSVVGPGFRGLWGHEGKILLLVDGKEMNELLYSTMQLGNEFPMELVERVEVVRGPGSVIYGGNAELAVINVVTRGVQGGTDALVSGTWGQFTQAPSAATGYARRSATVSGRYVFESVPGLSAFVSASLGQGQRSARDFVGTDGNSKSMAGNSDLDPAVVQAGIGYRDLQATFLYHRYDTRSITGFGSPLEQKAVTGFESFHGELVGTFRPSPRLEIIPRFNLTVQTPWADRDPASEFYYDKTARRVRGRLIARWAPLDELQVTAGADAMFDHAQLNGPAEVDGQPVGLQTTFAGKDAVDYQTLAGFLELFSENPVVNVAAGARYDLNSAVGGALVPRVVLLRSFGPVSLKGLVSLAFRWPGIENLNLFAPTDSAPSLKPERTTVYEFEGSVALARQMRLSANVFNIGIDAPIAYTVDPATGAEGYLNLGKQGTTGGELTYRARGGWGRVEASYSLYVPTLQDNVPNYLAPGRTDMFLAAPAHRAVLAGTFKPLAWLAVTPSVLVFGPRLAATYDEDGNAAGVQETPTQVLANLVVRTDNLFTQGLSASLGVYNILGTDYRHVQAYTGGHAPVPALDREVMLRVGYVFEPSYE